MQYRTLGRTGLQVSLAGLGTGGASQLGQKTGRTANQSHAVVHAALDLGINLIDSSAAYGQSEELLGQALKGVARDRYVLATKFVPQRDGVLREPEEMLAQLEHSLEVLGCEGIDVYQYHMVPPDLYRPIIDRFQPLLLRAQEQGKIRFIGLTETVTGDPLHQMLPMALADDLFDTLMIKYGILNQSGAAGVLPLAQAHNVGVLVMAPVRTSLRSAQEATATLNTIIDRGDQILTRPNPADPLGLAIDGAAAPSTTRAGYQFAADNAAVSSVLIGTGNPDHLRANVADLLAEPMTPRQLDHLRQAFGHLAWPS